MQENAQPHQFKRINSGSQEQALLTRSGFTIVELLIVIVVIGILAAISLAAYNGVTGRANDTAALSNAQQAGKKVTLYALSNGEVLPADLATAGLTDGAATYQYTLNTASSPNTFCLTATSGTTSAHTAGTTSSVNTAVAGPCPGHTGTSPTVAASGEACPTNYIVVPGSSLYGTEAFCVMKREAQNSGGSAVSTSTGTPWVSISQTAAISTAAAACDGCHLITEAEWLTIAQNVMSVGSNWSGGAVGSGALHSGHNDNSPGQALTGWADSNPCYGTITAGVGASCGSSGAQQRTLTLTNGEVIWDLAGNVYEWTNATIGAGQQPGLSAESGFSWKQYNNGSLLWNELPNSARPATGTPAAASWSSAQGIGQLYSNYGEAAIRAFVRGGNWSSPSYAGVLALNLSTSAAGTNVSVGFRVAR